MKKVTRTAYKNVATRVDVFVDNKGKEHTTEKQALAADKMYDDIEKCEKTFNKKNFDYVLHRSDFFYHAGSCEHAFVFTITQENVKMLNCKALELLGVSVGDSQAFLENILESPFKPNVYMYVEFKEDNYNGPDWYYSYSGPYSNYLDQFDKLQKEAVDLVANV